MEVWLRPNRRVLLLGMVPAALIVGLGIAFALATSSTIMQAVGWLMVATGVLLIIGMTLQLRKPRVAYLDGKVLFYLQARSPIETPIEAVEAFFLGQSPTELPGVPVDDAESVNLVARISQRRPEWANVSVKPALGSWESGYATIRGVWCEPLTTDVVRRINRRLREVQQPQAEGESEVRDEACCSPREVNDLPGANCNRSTDGTNAP